MEQDVTAAEAKRKADKAAAREARKANGDAPRKRRSSTSCAVPDGMSFDETVKAYAILNDHVGGLRDALAELSPVAREFAIGMLPQALQAKS